MRQASLISIFLLSLYLMVAMPNQARSQENCVLQPPVIHIDFGSGNEQVDPNLSSSDNYERIYQDCPGDGHYSILSYSSGCHGNHWITLNQDHTPGDANGKLMLVNAAYQPGTFFVTALKGLSPNKKYEFGVWLVNVCKPEYECTDIRPSLRFSIETSTGVEVARFATGEVTPTGQVSWLQYTAMFTAPAVVGPLFLKVFNKNDGGCGNDFAMDDITVRECIIPPVEKATTAPKPVVKPTTPPKAVASTVPVKKAVAKQTPPAPTAAKKVVLASPGPVARDSAVASRPATGQRASISIPKPISSRANPVVKHIETVNSEIVIDLYDNGEIDGDTVSIYHNNNLVVSRAALSEKAVSFHFQVDGTNPHHELVMVANNLGSIPPNTSLMIVTTRDKRYEVFISSSEQKNAKVVIDLKNP